MEPRLTLGLIFTRTASLAAAAPLPTAAAFAGLLLPWFAIDLMGEEEAAAASLLLLLPMLLVPYLFTTALLRRLGLLKAAGQPGRVASYVGAGIVTAIGILIGLLCLILPGIYLLARWAIVTPLLIGEGLNTADAIAQSGQRTARAFGPILGASAILILPELLLVGAYIASLNGVELFGTRTWIMFGDLVSAIFFVATLLAAVTIYALTRPGDQP